jgi:hypothetical protein
VHFVDGVAAENGAVIPSRGTGHTTILAPPVPQASVAHPGPRAFRAAPAMPSRQESEFRAPIFEAIVSSGVELCDWQAQQLSPAAAGGPRRKGIPLNCPGPERMAFSVVVVTAQATGYVRPTG